jgi:hypothetical protein
MLSQRIYDDTNGPSSFITMLNIHCFTENALVSYRLFFPVILLSTLARRLIRGDEFEFQMNILVN